MTPTAREAGALAATLVAAALGGFVAKALGLPLPFLLGALVVTAAAAIGGLTVMGAPLALPQDIRMYFVPVIGVAIGAAFTPAVLEEAARWWPTLLGLAVFVPLAHTLCFLITRRAAGVDRVTAFYGTMPGGFIEAITMGEEAGADVALLSVMTAGLGSCDGGRIGLPPSSVLLFNFAPGAVGRHVK